MRSFCFQMLAFRWPRFAVCLHWTSRGRCTGNDILFCACVVLVSNVSICWNLYIDLVIYDIYPFLDQYSYFCSGCSSHDDHTENGDSGRETESQVLWSYAKKRYQICILIYLCHDWCGCCRLAAKCCAVLLPLLGLTWSFGVLAIDQNVVIFLYLFAIFNSLQVWKIGRHSVYQSVIQSINQSDSQSFSLSVSQTVSHSVYQSVRQSVIQSISQSFSLSVS